MASLSMLRKTHFPVIASRAKRSLSLWRSSMAVVVCTLMTPALALAHGGMGPDEIGPPIITSGLLGFAGYWVVMLWPAVKKKDDQEVGVSGQAPHSPRTPRRAYKRSAHMRRAPRLRKIEGSGQFDSDQKVRRKVNDG